MNKIQRIFSCLIVSFILSSCGVHNQRDIRCLLHRPYPLKQTMFVCEVQYRIPGSNSTDRYFMNNPHVFQTTCADSMYSLGYHTKPSVWPQGRGDFREMEWMVARLPTGTLFIVDNYNMPGLFSEEPAVAYVTIASGPYKGLHVEWLWFDFTREVIRPLYPNIKPETLRLGGE